MWFADILPPLKHVGFCFSSGSVLKSRDIQSGFCRTRWRSFGVAFRLSVAPLGVSVLPLHASLSACNRDTLSFASVCLKMCNALNLVSKAFQAVVLLHAIAGLDCRAISMTLDCLQHLIYAAIHPTSKDRGLSRLIVVIDRDYNASLNILQRGLLMLPQGLRELTPVEIRCGSRKQEQTIGQPIGVHFKYRSC